jgi:hypothetical protein
MREVTTNPDVALFVPGKSACKDIYSTKWDANSCDPVRGWITSQQFFVDDRYSVHVLRRIEPF